jgi:hypothetical protein
MHQAVDEAVRLLREGEVVALPTETVYGLAANALDALMAAMPPERLLAICGENATHDAPLGSNVRFAAMINGVIQHNVYHAGQVVMLTKALRD